MIKSALNKILDLETDEIVKSALETISLSTGDAQADDALQPAQALTLDDRLNLYLNAVYGSRDFTSEDYAGARELLLDAMAANFRAHHKTDVPDLDDLNSPVNPEPDHELPSRIESLLEVQDASFRKENFASRAASSSILRPLNRGSKALDPMFCVEDIAPNKPDYRPSGRTSSLARESGSRRTRLSYFSAIAATVCLLLTSSAVLYVLFSGLKQNNTFADLSLEQLNGIQFQRIQEAASMKRDADGAGVAPRLLDLGNRLIASGDLDGGRLVLAEAAEKGSASAALSLGSTFDPNEASTKNASSDLAKAKFWYLRAKTLGEQNAQARLEKLDSLATPR